VKLPAFLHGLHKDVKARCLRKAKALAKGATWEELASDWLETSEAPGLIVLQGPNPGLGGQPHFHVFALVRAMNDTLGYSRTDEVTGRAFRSALGTPWGVLCFMGQDSYHYVNPPGSQLPFLEACARNWAELDGEGARYSMGTLDGKRLWESPTMIQYLLGQRGLPGVIVQKPLGPEGLAPLVEQVRQPRLPALRREWTPDKPAASRAQTSEED
jgi:hypothetical protein